MKKIVILGIDTDLRYKIEHWLNENYEIIGYSDLSDKYTNCTTFAYKKYYKIHELFVRQNEIDYIIVCETNYKRWYEINNELTFSGIDEKKILPTLVFAHPERAFVSPYNDFLRINKRFSSLLFGMSYSRSGFMPHFLKDSWFKFSIGGGDLHTYDLWLSNLVINHFDLLSNVKQIALELPYYIFNWDIQCSNQIYTRMLYFDEFNDYGGFLVKKEDAWQYILKYRALKNIFSARYEQCEGVFTNHVYDVRELNTFIKNKSKEYFIADKIWMKSHKETEMVNISRLDHILQICNKFNFNTTIIIYPMSPCFILNNVEIIERNRSYFYSALEKLGYSGKVIDFMDLNKEKDLFTDKDFRDLTHLNTNGGNKCSIILNQLIE